jgi:ATP-dependent Clp protease ATP-binding subunit ClpA
VMVHLKDAEGTPSLSFEITPAPPKKGKKGGKAKVGVGA